MGQEDVNKITKETSLLQRITTAVGILGGGTVIFYALGFTIVNTYIRRVGLEGMFWLTKEFYVDAGAKFLLEMIRSPLLAPQLFFSYLLMLFFLVPKDTTHFKINPMKKVGQSPAEAAFIRKQIIKLSVMFLLISGTFLFTTYYDHMQQNSLFLLIFKYANFFDADKALLTSSLTNRDTSLVFFSIGTPLVIIFGNFFYRFRRILKERSRRRLYYRVAFIVYVVFLASIPISYANNIYDWKLIPIKDPQIVENIISQEKGELLADIDKPFGLEPSESYLVSTRIWLLAQSDDKYFFLTKRGGFSEGIIEVIDAEKIGHLNFPFDPYQVDFLSSQILKYEQPDVPSLVNAFDYLKFDKIKVE